MAYYENDRRDRDDRRNDRRDDRRDRNRQGSRKTKESVTQIRADKQVLSASKRAYEIGQIRTQCSCGHKNSSGKNAIVQSNRKNKDGESIRSKFTNSVMCICTECGKEIDITPYTEDDVLRSVDLIDRVCDFSKLRLNLDMEADSALHNTIKTFQYQLLMMVPDLFKSTKKNKKKNKDGGGNRGTDFEIRRPASTRGKIY